MRSLAFVSILALTLVACGGGSSSGAPATGTLNLMITDGPFEWDLVESATVCIVRVEARNADLGGWQTLYPPPPPPPADDTTDPAEPVDPVEPSDPVEAECIEVDLMPLTGGVTALLAQIEVPVGTYNEVRLIVEAGEVVLTDLAHVAADPEDPESYIFNTENGNLRFPSGSQSGIKVKIDNDIVVSSELSADLTLEFDLSRNFVFNGQPDAAPGVKRINFTPVVRATNVTTNGTIALQVLADPSTVDVPAEVINAPFPTVDVYSVAADDTATYVTTATGAEDGTLRISLLPGIYDLVVMAKGYETGSVDDVTVIVGNVTDAGTVTLDRAVFWLGGQVLSDMGTPVGDPAAGTETDDDVPIVGATVTVWAPTAVPGTDAALATQTTDANGSWHVTGLTSGLLPDTYVVRIAADDHDAAEIADVIVVEYEPTTVDATLVKTATSAP